MQPELVAAFVSEFTAEWNRLRAEASASLVGQRRELEQVERKLSGLIDMMIDGFRAPGLQAKLNEIEQRKQALLVAIAAAEAGPALPRLHGNLSEFYLDKVAKLRAAFAAGGGTEVLEAMRALVERVEVNTPPRLSGRPALSCWATYRRCCGRRAWCPERKKSPGVVAEAFVMAM